MKGMLGMIAVQEALFLVRTLLKREAILVVFFLNLIYLADVLTCKYN